MPSTRQGTSCDSAGGSGLCSSGRLRGWTNCTAPSALIRTRKSPSWRRRWCRRQRSTRFESLVSPPSAQWTMWWASQWFEVQPGKRHLGRGTRGRAGSAVEWCGSCGRRSESGRNGDPCRPCPRRRRCGGLFPRKQGRGSRRARCRPSGAFPRKRGVPVQLSASPSGPSVLRRSHERRPGSGGRSTLLRNRPSVRSWQRERERRRAPCRQAGGTA